jgi:PAS domain S-box-containing protein
VTAHRLNIADSVRRKFEKSNAQLASIVDSSGDAIIGVAPDLSITSWNAAAERMYGYASDEVIGQPLSILLHSESQDAPSTWRFTLAEGEVQHLRRSHVTKEGRRIDVAVTLSPVRNDCGAVVGMSDIVRDVTQTTQMREDLRKSTEELNAFFTTNLDLLCIADVDGHFVKLNPEWEHVLGYPIAELEGNVFLDYVHPDDVDGTLQAIDSLSEQQDVVNFANRYRTKDGSYRWIEWKSHPVGDLIYAAARDITARKITELALEEASKELESFSYSVSHDLRAPLRHVSGFVELLKQNSADRLDEHGQHYLETIAESATDMGTLIDDLLAFSRMGRAAMTMERLDLGDMVREYIADLDNGTKERGIEWIIGELPAVHADRSMMRQILANLLGNAVKYTRKRERPRIEVGAYPDDGEVVVFVRDNGVGFDMAYVDKLFGVFQRLHDATEFEGTGIGLANVRRVISRHGGRTWAEGAVGQGATFYFSLPNRVADPGPKDHDDEWKR